MMDATPDRSKHSLPEGEAKRSAVRGMFDRIAPRYDLMNRLMTGGLDQRWRRRLLEQAAVGSGDRLVDLACGTGDLCELAEARGASCVGIDFAREMLRGAVRRGVGSPLVCGDAAELPVADGAASVVTCGFALRNFVALESVWDEIARILEPGGRLAVIEVDRPESGLLRFGHSLYFDRVVPRLGALLSDREAYRYLPKSTAYLPPFSDIRRQLEAAGFENIQREGLLFGSAQFILAERRKEKHVEVGS